MLVLFMLILSQIQVNEIVGTSIDSLEAIKYHVFTDVAGFQSAQFFQSEDSVIVRVEYRVNDTIYDSSVTIDHEVLKSLDSYIRNFRMIIENEDFRLSFIEAFKIDWPIIAQADIERINKSSSQDRIKATACCMTAACAVGAYSAALLTRDVRTEVDTAVVPVPCLIGTNGTGCISIPVPVERKIFSINPYAYALGATAGSGLGYLWAKKQIRSKHVLSMAITQDIIAFDTQDFPITEQEISIANRGTNEMLLGTVGLGAGLLGAGATAYVLLTPWSSMHAEEQWHAGAIQATVVVICVAELVIITNYLINKGKQLDRQATIEKLKQRRTQ